MSTAVAMTDVLFSAISQYPITFAVFTVSLLEIPSALLSRFAPSVFPIEYADVYSILLASVISVVYYVQSTHTARQSFLCLAVVIWSFRLATFLGSRIKAGFHDSRLDKFRGSAKGAATWCFAQTLWITVTLIPVWIGMSSYAKMSSLGKVDLLAMVHSSIGLIIETVADIQKTVFRARNKAQPEASRKPVCDIGLFKYSRFPNYFGEWLFWTSLCLLVWQGSDGFIKMLLPFCSWFILKIFFLLSIPLAVKVVKARASESQFAEWCEISTFVPLPLSKSTGS